MSYTRELRTRIRTLDERLARLRAEKDRLLARASQTERRRDTRCKILIGGTILAAVDHEGVPPLATKTDLLAWLETRLARPHDRAVFGFALQELVAAEGTPRPSAIAALSARSGAAVKEAVPRSPAPQSGAKRP